MAESYKYLFGPVPSRRLGLSLGVDIVPFKTCTQNCIYCQLGRNAATTLERKPWVVVDEVAAELSAAVAAGLHADYITISGSGEPTLNSELGAIIDAIRAATSIPIAVITNGTLLNDPAVRLDCEKADVILPSLDAGDEETFQAINKPHSGVTLASLAEGLKLLRREFSGSIWLEVFIVEGINTSEDQLEKLKRLIEEIGPDKVHLNTAVRPTAEAGVFPASPERLAEIAMFLGPRAEVVADFKAPAGVSLSAVGSEHILATLRRRPCSLRDICESLGISPNEAVKHLEKLREADRIESERRNDIAFFHLK